MIEHTLRAFCESRYRWIIVIFGTCGAGFALLLPLVDTYSKKQEDKQRLAHELTEAQQIAADLDHFRARVNENLDEFEQLASRTVSENTLADFRSRLEDVARETGCTLRRLSLGNVQNRPWYEGDDPLEAQPDAEIRKPELATPYILQRFPVSVTLSGSMANLKSMLTKLREDQMLLHTKHLDLHAAGRSRGTVMLDLELWYFALLRQG